MEVGDKAVNIRGPCTTPLALLIEGGRGVVVEEEGEELQGHVRVLHLGVREVGRVAAGPN